MSKLVLHIGTWKTGTTTIQNVFDRNRRYLLENEISFPINGPNHLFLTSLFHEHPMNFIVAKHHGFSDLELMDWHAKQVGKFEDWISRSKTTVCSGEHMFDLWREGVSNLKKFLYDYFSEIRVIIYFRDPVSHYISSICEEVKQGHYPLEVAYEKLAKDDKLKKLKNWIEIFGKDNICIRKFDKNSFLDGDLIKDFVVSAGLGTIYQGLETEANEAVNESLSYPGLLIASELAKIAPSYSDERFVRKELYSISGCKFVPPKKYLANVLERNLEFCTYLNDEFGLKFDTTLDSYQEIEMSDIWSDKAVSSLAYLINSLCKRENS